MSTRQHVDPLIREVVPLATEELESLNEYILALARKKVPRSVIPQEMVELEIDELAQNARIKFWLARQRGLIEKPKAYINVLLSNEAVNIVRRYKQKSQLSLDDVGEICQGKIVAAGREEQDPLQQLLQEEMVTEYMERTASAVVALPHCQQRAMICNLKDRLDSIVQLTAVFLAYGIDIKTICWPKEKRRLQSYRSSLSVARSKINILIRQC